MSTGALSRETASGPAVLSRVTLVGERRRVDLVLPAREPVGLLLPEIMRVLDDRAAGRPAVRHLVTVDGSALDHDSTLESAGIRDGAVLRLVRAEDAPPAPVVHDVTDEVAEDLGHRAWVWGPAARRVTAGVACVGWVVVAALFARAQYDRSVVAGALLAAAGAAAVAGAVLGRVRRHALAATLLCAGGALGVLGVWSLVDDLGGSSAGALRLGGVAVVGVLFLALLGLFTPLGRGGIVGAGAVAVTAVGWEAAIAVQSGAGTAPEQARVGAVLGVVCVVALGVLPRLALMVSGLSGLDDRRAGGVSVSRYQVSAALAAAHRGLVLATVTLAGSAAAAAVLALRDPSAWTVSLAAVVAVVLALRARAFPLVAEVVVLPVAAAFVVVRLLLVWAERASAAAPLAVLVALAVLPLAVLAVEPAEHVRVRLRRAGDLLESVGVITLLPLLVGVFGVYGRLLDTFA
ncbi:type VII secretion integral membrane protein EccD [Streptomyces sp. CHD11]|uniref:type VII secretion integral membrane protein EccD n=1 Tax=Streptomyces sp. CHD11 TaxID=2741325 RepID=UPI001BFCCE8B|nr:type VII secretion integral membrane protein EccD [Streptomyces sp. CHD11]MBT3151114.1 type VII secretion integral membrane protein EccD [Streptomyces sp. CHD11]